MLIEALNVCQQLCVSHSCAFEANFSLKSTCCFFVGRKQVLLNCENLCFGFSVGIIGYPNVGKSSIINTLKAKKVCKVAPIAGETKVKI